MGRTIEQLASREVSGKAVFNNRFVVEIAENVHVHYRNLRIVLSVEDWVEMAKGMKDSLERWNKLGSPEPKEGQHIELCRKHVASKPLLDDKITVNLNRNLYIENEGKIYSDGNELTDPTYIHLKSRDFRLEFPIGEFKQLAEAVKEADTCLAQPS